MSVGERLRRARLAKGWTQAELAQAAGVSQAYVSELERGRGGAPKRIAAISKVLGVSSEAEERPTQSSSSASFDEALQWTSPRQPLSLPLDIKTFLRPDVSGDFFLFLPLPLREVLVVAADVGGNGRAAAPGSIYLQGWLRGWISSLAAPPRLEHLARELQQESEAARVDLSFFVALLSPHPDLPHTVRYTGLSIGYPAPILLAGGGKRTMPSAGEINRVGLGASVFHEALSAPWKLAVASDGLLRRLGAGSEADGKASMLRWQAGARQAAHPHSYLKADQATVADESFALLQWGAWDARASFNVLDQAERHRVKTAVRAAARTAIGERGAAAVGTALGEALDNAHVHAYGGGDGVVDVRYRAIQSRFQMEISDEGLGHIAREGDGIQLMQRWGCEVDYFGASPRGTCISIMFDRDKAQGD
jgi:transcriptional regulator with XRE-family HTH domain